MGCGYSKTELNFQKSAHSRRRLSEDHRFIEERHLASETTPPPIQSLSSRLEDGNRTPSQNTNSTILSPSNSAQVLTRRNKFGFLGRYSWTQGMDQPTKTIRAIDEALVTPRSPANIDAIRPASSPCNGGPRHVHRVSSRDDIRSEASSFVFVQRKVVVAWEGDGPNSRGAENADVVPLDSVSNSYYESAEEDNSCNMMGIVNSEEISEQNFQQEPSPEPTTSHNATSSISSNILLVPNSTQETNEEKMNENSADEPEHQSNNQESSTEQTQFSSNCSTFYDLLDLKILLQVQFRFDKLDTLNILNEDDCQQICYIDENFAIEQRASVANFFNEEFEYNFDYQVEIKSR